MIFSDCTFEGNKSLNEKYKNPSVMDIDGFGDVTLKNCTFKNNIGGYLIDVTSVLNPAELRLDGVVKTVDNFDRDGNHVGIVCSDMSTLYSYIDLNKGFSKESVIDITVNDTSPKNDVIVNDLPGEWSTAELVHTFNLCDTFGIGGSTSDYYIEKSGSDLKFNTGDISKSIVEIYKKENPQPETTPELEIPSKPSVPKFNLTDNVSETEIKGEPIKETIDIGEYEKADVDDYVSSASDIANSNTTGSVIGEGSMTTVIILLAVCVVAVAVIGVSVKKKKK